MSRKFDDVVGGVERMVLSIADQLQSIGHEVTVISLDNEDAKPFYPWPSDISWIKVSLGDPDLRANVLTRIRRIRFIRQILRQQKIDCIIGFQLGSFALVRAAAIGMSVFSIAAERNSPTLYRFIRRGRALRLYSWLILATSDRIAIQMPSYVGEYPFFLKRRIRITPNAVKRATTFRRQSKNLVGSKVPDLKVLFVGRVTFQKNVQCLVQAMALLEIPCRLTIVGDGDNLHEIREMSAHFNLNVTFQSFSTNLEEYYLESDVLCLPSRWEGFPNVVAEALAHGLPVVGFENCSGVRDLITPGVNGFLARGNGNASSLAAALKATWDTRIDPKSCIRSVEWFSKENSIQHWKAALELVKS
jgi:glycosyltransferase involved in cell wall biosynthesis